jgi:hypothetical protein
LPSARSSAARAFIAARSAALKPADPAWELLADIATLPFGSNGRARCRPVEERLIPPPPLALL